MARTFGTQIALPFDPTTALQAATKQYVDNQRGPLGGVYTITYASSITPNAATAVEQRVVATGALTVNVPTGGTDGQVLLLWVQASGAGRVVTVASGFENSQAVPNGVITVPSGTWGSILMRLRAGTWVLMAAMPQPGTTPVVVTFSATATVFDASQGNHFRVTLTASMTTAPTVTNPTDGQRILLEYVQDTTGGRTPLLPSNFNVTTGITGAATFTTTASTHTYVGAVYRASASKWDVLAFGTGVAN